jgi:hypothetical protein
MNARLRSIVRRGSILALVGLALASGCARKPKGGAPPVTVPLQLQTAVAIDKDGNQILAGSFAGKLKIGAAELASAGGTDVFVAKTSKAGAQVFPPLRFGGAGDDAATGVAVDTDESIVVTGTIQGEATFGDQTLKADVRHPRQRAVFVARLDAAGKVVWVKQIAVVNLPTLVSVAVGPDHNIVVGATATGTVTKKDGPVAEAGESATVEILSPGGEPMMQPAGSQVKALSLSIGCLHSPCHAGLPLDPACGFYSCVATICSNDIDPYCCHVEWDSICIGEVTQYCQRRCDCSGVFTDGLPYYPDASPCTAAVYSRGGDGTGDHYCSEVWWDGICISETSSPSITASCHPPCQ